MNIETSMATSIDQALNGFTTSHGQTHTKDEPKGGNRTYLDVDAEKKTKTEAENQSRIQ